MNHEPHIMTAFDRDLAAIKQTVLKMGAMVRAGVGDAALALGSRDDRLADTLLRRDAMIDALEAEVDEACARLIALRIPTAGDLRSILAVIKIASALERIGDLAKNTGRRSTLLSRMASVDDSAASIQRIARCVDQRLADALDAYARHDVQLALDVWHRDSEVDHMCNALFREFLTYMMEDPANVTVLVHLQFITKNLERIGDHATGIAEQAVYIATGAAPATLRPKEDFALCN